MTIFKGRPHEWGDGGGSTGKDHPFRKKTQRLVERYERNHELNRGVTLAQLALLGIPFETLVDPEEALSEIDRFEEERGLDNGPVDRVLQAFEAARYDHEESFNAPEE